MGLDMRFNNTFIRCLTAALLMVSLFCVCSIAGSTPDVYAASETENLIESTGAEIVPFGEQTEWVYRVVNGRLQMRLWSITYGIWRTEWLWV